MVDEGLAIPCLLFPTLNFKFSQRLIARLAKFLQSLSVRVLLLLQFALILLLRFLQSQCQILSPLCAFGLCMRRQVSQTDGQVCAAAKHAVVAMRTRLLTRCGWAAAKACAVIPPIDRPTT